MLIKKNKRGIQYQDSQWGAGYTLTTPIPSDPPMTEEELLAHETPFNALILWSGGNGPHKYQVIKASKEICSFWGHQMDGGIDLVTRYLCLSPQAEPYKQREHVYIGRERYSTKVWSLEAAE